MPCVCPYRAHCLILYLCQRYCPFSQVGGLNGDLQLQRQRPPVLTDFTSILIMFSDICILKYKPNHAFTHTYTHTHTHTTHTHTQTHTHIHTHTHTHTYTHIQHTHTNTHTHTHIYIYIYIHIYIYIN